MGHPASNPPESTEGGANDDRRMFLGVDIGGTTISVGLVDSCGTLQGAADAGDAKGAQVQCERLGNDHDPARVALRVRKLADAALAGAGLAMDAVAGVGVCTPGLLDIHRGVVCVAANLEGWRDVPVCDLLAEALGLPRACVVLENDTNAALLAEVWVGAAAGRSNVVLMTLGTGIGGAIMCDGRLLRGSRGQAGEIGHSILVPDGREHGKAGVRGIFEGYASATAVSLRAGEAAKGVGQNGAPPPECSEVFARAESGNEEAMAIVRETARCLAIGCINCCRFVDPDTIIFSGGMAQAGEFLLREVRAQFAAYHWNIEPVRVEILQAAAAATSGVIGAAFAAKQRTDGPGRGSA